MSSQQYEPGFVLKLEELFFLKGTLANLYSCKGYSKPLQSGQERHCDKSHHCEQKLQKLFVWPGNSLETQLPPAFVWPGRYYQRINDPYQDLQCLWRFLSVFFFPLFPVRVGVCTVFSHERSVYRLRVCIRSHPLRPMRDAVSVLKHHYKIREKSLIL